MHLLNLGCAPVFVQCPLALFRPLPPPTCPPPPSPAGPEGEPPLLGEDGLRVLRACEELDYMTHIVLRMFENMT